MPDQGTNDALLTSDAFSQNPYPVYDQLRKEKPVYWSNAVGAWWLTCIAGDVAKYDKSSKSTQPAATTWDVGTTCTPQHSRYLSA